MNEELDSTHGTLKGKLNVIDAELNDVKSRLSKLYDALETGKLSLDDLAQRIKELRERQDVLDKTRIQVEAEMVVQGTEHVDIELIKSYAEDLRGLLEEVGHIEYKAFLRSFVKRIIIDGQTAVIQYNVPMPPDGKRKQKVEVLPIDTLGGAGGIRTPDLLTASRL